MLRILLFLILSTSCSAVTSDEVIAAVIIGEAGGEGQIGMRAVASVIANRIRPDKDAFFVVTQKFQFSCINNKEHENFVNKARRHPRWSFAVELTKEINDGELVDVTDGATHFLNTAKVRRMPRWAYLFEFKGKIGAHSFYKET